MRLTEVLRLRVMDIDFQMMSIKVRDGKGEKDHVTMLPTSIVMPLKINLERIRILHQKDLPNGFGEGWLPCALARKYTDAKKNLRGNLFFLRQKFHRPAKTANCEDITLLKARFRKR